MIQAATRLEKILNELPSKLLSYTEQQASERPAPGKWSKKEIMGHLIDSASNNHQRFVRMQIDNGLALPQYKQNEWVQVEHYQERNWIDIVKFWMTYNMHILHIFKTVDESKLSNTATFPEYGTLKLQFIMDDYIDHMEHHFKAVFK